MSVRQLVVAFGLVAGLATSGQAAVMHVHDSLGNLGKVDTETGSVSLIGNMGVTMTDIAFDPLGNLYGLDFESFYSINATTGAASLIGVHDISGANALVFNEDGTAYAAGNASRGLFTINPGTGAGSLLGETGFGSGGDLAFNAGSLYLASAGAELVKIDLADLGASAVVGSFGVSDVYGLATAPDGRLYGVAGTTIYEVDRATGIATNGVSFAGQGLFNAFGQGFYTEAGAPQPAPIPLPASGLLLLAGLAILPVLRRREARQL